MSLNFKSIYKPIDYYLYEKKEKQNNILNRKVKMHI